MDHPLFELQLVGDSTRSAIRSLRRIAPGARTTPGAISATDDSQSQLVLLVVQSVWSTCSPVPGTISSITSEPPW